MARYYIYAQGSYPDRGGTELPPIVVDLKLYEQFISGKGADIHVRVGDFVCSASKALLCTKPSYFPEISGLDGVIAGVTEIVFRDYSLSVVYALLKYLHCGVYYHDQDDFSSGPLAWKWPKHDMKLRELAETAQDMELMHQISFKFAQQLCNDHARSLASILETTAMVQLHLARKGLHLRRQLVQFLLRHRNLVYLNHDMTLTDFLDGNHALCRKLHVSYGRRFRLSNTCRDCSDSHRDAESLWTLAHKQTLGPRQDAILVERFLEEYCQDAEVE